MGYWQRLANLQIREGWRLSPSFSQQMVRFTYGYAENCQAILVARSPNSYPVQLFGQKSFPIKTGGKSDVWQIVGNAPSSADALCFKTFPYVSSKPSSVFLLLDVLQGDQDVPLNNPSTPYSTTSTGSTVAAATTNTPLLAANANRKGATVWNSSTATLNLELGSTATTSAFTAQLAPGGYYEVPYGYTGAIAGIWSAANGSALVRELT